MRHLVLALTLITVFGCGQIVGKDGGWVGQRVILKEGAHLNDGSHAGTEQGLDYVYRVERVEGKRLWLRSEEGDDRGWVFESRVVPFEEAINYLTSLTITHPSDSRLYVRRGLVWMKKDRCDRAIVDFNEAIRLAPDGAGYLNRGLAWRSKKEFDKAIADITEAIQRDTKHALSYHARGLTWAMKGEPDMAIADYDEAIRLDPMNGASYGNRGQAWRAKGEFDKAIADFNALIRMEPRYPLPYPDRAYCWYWKREYARAITDYTLAVELDPKFAYAYNGRAWIWATCPDGRFRDGARAVASSTRACEESKWKDGYYLDTLAAASAEAGDFNAAVKWEEKALEMLTDEPAKQRGHARLELYRARKPYRDEPKTN